MTTIVTQYVELDKHKADNSLSAPRYARICLYAPARVLTPKSTAPDHMFFSDQASRMLHSLRAISYDPYLDRLVCLGMLKDKLEESSLWPCIFRLGNESKDAGLAT
jgi:hypothetical protein